MQFIKPGEKVVNFPGGNMKLVLMTKILGKGAFGQVHLSYQQNDPSKFYAVKVIDKRRLDGQTNSMLQREM